MIQEHEIVLYQVEGTNICVNVVFKDETFWMTQKAMAELFDVNVPAISKHLSNIFEEGELFKEATVSKMEIVQIEGEQKAKRIQDIRCIILKAFDDIDRLTAEKLNNPA